MADDEKPSLHIDTDWKKQAQEEKKRLAEQQQRAAASPPPPRVPPAGMGLAPGPATAPATGMGPGAGPGPGASPAAMPTSAAASARGRRELPPASFATLVQSAMTQALFYLGELAPQGSEPMLNLDMAKHQIESLGVLEEKTINNLTDDEKRLLDAALYETRTRFISVAQQFIG
jgi:hypothetical protein